MKFALLVLASPYGSQAGDSAWRFAEAAVQAGHCVYRVFFFHEGVYHGNHHAVPPQDEVNRVLRWAEFASRHQTELVLCVASALKRGILDEREAARHDKLAANMHPAFEISGLGQLIDASAHCDRLLTFGA